MENTGFFNHPDRLVTKSEVKALTGNPSDSTLWRMEHDLPDGNPKRFPARIRLSRNRVAWRLGDVLDWIERQRAN
jgi:predicted DNA-binding transcriptional regulator AlpA